MTTTKNDHPGVAPAYLTGALSICGGVALFNVVDVIIKLVSAGYPFYEFALVRAAATLPLLSIYVAREGGLAVLHVQRGELGLIVLRGCLLFMGSMLFGLSLAVMAIADVVSIYFVMPLIVAAAAGPVLGEQVPLYRWGVMLVGFLGVLVIVRPGAGVFEPAGLLALGAAVIEGFAQLFARLLAAVRTSAIAFYQGLAFLAGSLVLTALFASGAWANDAHASLAFLTRGWVWPETKPLLIMLSAAPLSAIAMLLYVHGYKVAPASFVTSFEYTGILWATLLGFIFFADVSGWTTWAGAAIVIMAGLYMLHRDSKAGLL
ncbi:MAG: DMT family transporter [Hyphomicrobiaceae bacterium]|mgnify:CR=1 FL=1